MKIRRSLYYLPLVNAAEEIRLGDVFVKPYNENEDYHILMPQGIFRSGGSVIETSNFSSGDEFNSDVDKKIFSALELMKFSYFFFNPSTSLDIKGYVSSETFEAFRIIERHEDSSFEQKIPISNGMRDHMHSLEKYYSFRSALGQNQIFINQEEFQFFDYFNDENLDEEIFSSISLYNRCWETYSIHSYFHKALLARVSIESILGSAGLKKTDFPRTFFKNAIDLIEKQAKQNPNINDFFEHIKPHLEFIKLQIEHHLIGLKDARHIIAHEGKEIPEYRNVPFYLLWFPLFLITTFKPERINNNEIMRLILFFGLLRHKSDEWFTIKTSPNNKIIRSHIDTYTHHSRVIPKYLARNDEEIKKGVVEMMKNWMKQ